MKSNSYFVISLNVFTCFAFLYSCFCVINDVDIYFLLTDETGRFIITWFITGLVMDLLFSFIRKIINRKKV